MKPNNTNHSSLPLKKGLQSSDKPTNIQFDIAKHLLELQKLLQKQDQTLELLKKGQASQSALLIKLSNKVKAPRQAKSLLSADEMVLVDC